MQQAACGMARALCTGTASSEMHLGLPRAMHTWSHSAFKPDLGPGCPTSARGAKLHHGAG